MNQVKLNQKTAPNLNNEDFCNNNVPFLNLDDFNKKLYLVNLQELVIVKKGCVTLTCLQEHFTSASSRLSILVISEIVL